MYKAICSLSGGMDSATVLKWLVDEVAPLADGSNKVLAISFKYGSKHGDHESKQAAALCKHLGVDRKVINLTQVTKHLDSNLLKSGGDIPEGHYESETMKQTVVPGRNTMFTSILAAIAESQSIPVVGVGIHQGDHAIYPDCRPDYFKAMKLTVEKSTEGRVTLVAPFIDGNKATILEYGYQHAVPYQFTRTCYKDQVLSCGKCGACQERLEAFRSIGKEDPVAYEE